MSNAEKMAYVPVWEKLNLTFEEAAAYTGIGVGKLREMARNPACDFVLKNGAKTMLKRKRLEVYLDREDEI